ncbi:uncharacterized protein LOC120276118 [Dioscorea cayenensis subsp. rotundata]|uniref:Uncharacterized protein LOC120276118 n=1 Tax=Dioscorea cayennensis subsp. rotundata TaxID=55577 RepID=A0AB40CFT0_DIOCR|nr:uncharacterized protein LOC120276118 [Dioscorea cayenensis subsp. rotundata]
MTRPLLTGRLAKWALILMEFDITYTPQKAIKGQALADFLAAHPLPDESPLRCDLPDEETLAIEERKQCWQMYFDGASLIQLAIRPKIPQVRAGIGLIFISPDGGILRYSLSLSRPCTKNEAEYEALIAGLELAVSMGVQSLHIYGDSQLIINQVEGSFKTHKQELLQYNQRVIELLKQIPDVKLERVSKSINGKADSLAKLAKELADPDQEEIQVTIPNRRVLSSCFDEELENKKLRKEEILTVVEDDWREPFIKYLKSYDQLLLRCLSKEESEEVMHEVHSGVCGAHQSGPKMRLKIKHIGYYWPSMINDAYKMQDSANYAKPMGISFINTPILLHPTISSWPFEMWGTDVIGPIEPPSSRGHRFILAATDYFSRANGLAEAFNKTLSKLLKKAVSKSQRDWHERLPEVLWAYRTTYRTPTQSTPYSLVFGTEVVLPLEAQIPSLRIALQNELTNEDRVRLRLDELDALDERRLEAQQNLKAYKARMARAYNKMARIRTFEKGEMVWVLRRPIITNKHAGGKFKSNWEGPYIIEVVY